MLTRATDPRPARVLLTGFGPFPGVRENPSERLIRRQAVDPGLRPRMDCDMRTAVLPTEWQAVRSALPALLAEHDPDVILHFGVHERAAGLRVEQRARNHMGVAPDARGRRGTGTAIVSGAPRVLRSIGPSERLVSQLRAGGLQAALSVDAGRYLCNMLFYLSLLHAQGTGRPHAVQFVHIPRVAEPGRHGPGRPMTSAELDAGVAALIKVCLAFRPPRSLGRGRHGTEIAA